MLMELLERLQGEDGFVGTDEQQQLPPIISCTPDRCKHLTQCTAKDAQLGQDKELQERVGFSSFQKTPRLSPSAKGFLPKRFNHVEPSVSLWRLLDPS